MKAYARFDLSLTMGYFLNGPSILEVKFANLVPLCHHLLVYGQDEWWPLIFILGFQ